MRLSSSLWVLAASVAAAPAAIVGCSEDGATGATVTTTSSSAATTGGGACEPKDALCTQVKSECISLADNSAATPLGLRMAQFTLTHPKALGAGETNLANTITMNLIECNLGGSGMFSWLLQLDTGAGKLLTGGAGPTADPVAGYCFVKATLNGSPVAPVEVDAALVDRKFSAKIPYIVIPIDLDVTAMSYALLPLHEVALTGELSADNNCIGRYNSDILDPANDCFAEPPDKLAFTNAGTIDGYITLEEADTVIDNALGQSLCVVLSGDPATYGDGMSPLRCKRDPASTEIVYRGDWCGMTNMASDETCYDAAKISAEYAASGVKINGLCG